MAFPSAPRRTPLVRRVLVLFSSAMLAAMPLGSLAVVVAPASPARAAGPVYPSLDGGGTSVLGAYATAGVVDLTQPAASGPANPDPASVTATAGSSALQGASILKSDLTGSELSSVTLLSLGLESLPIQLPLSTMPLTRTVAPRSWQDVLTGTPLAGIPLQNVTWSQVVSLGAARPAVVATLTLGDVDWSGSALRDLPLAAFTFGGSSVTDIAIPLQPNEPSTDTTNAQRWCYLLNQSQPGSCPNAASLTGKSLIDIGVEGAPLKNIPLKNIPLKNIDLATSPLKNIPLKNIVLEVSPLKNIPLKNIDMTSAPLKNIPLKNIDLTTSPLKNIPLKNIAWASSPLKNIPLKNIDLASSPLKNIPLKNIDFLVAPLKNIPLKNIDLTGSGLGGLQLAGIAWPTAPIGATNLSQLSFASGPLSTIAIASTANPGAIAGCVATATCLAGETLLQAAAISDILPGATLAAIGTPGFTGHGTLADLLAARITGSTLDPALGDLRLDLATGAPGTTVAVLVASLSPAQADVLLGDLLLDAATGVDTLVLDAITGFLFSQTTLLPYLLGDLGTYTDITGHDITLGELGTWKDQTGADITLGDLAQYLDDSVSLSDVLLGLVPASQFPFEDFPIASLGLNQVGRSMLQPPDAFGVGGSFPAGFITNRPSDASIKLLGDSFSTSDPLNVVALLPPGSIFTAASSSGSSSQTGAVQITTDPDGRVRVVLPNLIVPPNTIGGAFFQWQNALRMESQDVTFELRVPATNALVTTEVVNVPRLGDGAEPNTAQEGLRYDNSEPGYVRVPNLPEDPNGCSATTPSCAGRDPALVDALAPGFISFPGDIDWYQIPNVRAGSRITADLTNLPLDADLVLYGPSSIQSSPTLFPSSAQGLPGRLVEDPGLGVGQAATALAANALNDLQLDPGFTDVTGTYAPQTPLSISQHAGTDPESVGVIAPVSGTYVVAVSGYNGATSNDPYLLRTRVLTPVTEASCPARSFPFAFSTPGSIPAIPTGVNTVFLTNPGRLAATYGQTAADAVASHLADLVTYLNANPGLGVTPAIVPLDAYPDVSGAYGAWDANPCSVSAANAVASQITKVLLDLRTSGVNLSYVTVVGGDDIVPMGRVPDLTRVSNESEYASTFGDALNPLSAAQKAGYTLTDDAYGDPSPTPVGDGSSLFVPRIAVGRLVETPADIEGQLDSFTHNGGTLDTSTGLVAGYDFLSDGAGAVASRLDIGGRSVDSSLVDPPGDTTPWTTADLLAKLFPGGATATPLIDSINGHYDHTALLSSAGNAGGTTDIETAADIASRSSANQLLGRVLFTMGCHAGLAVPDAYIAGTDAASATLKGDWAQTLSHAGVAVYVANTGFGIGDTSSVAYSERLMALYAKLLDGSITAGQALAYAKQAYYGSLGAVGVYDLKILQQAEFYGLPFWHVTTSPGATPVAPAAPPLPGLIGTDPVSGLAAMPVTVTPTLTPITAGNGKYWVVTGADGPEDPQVTQYRPIQPQTSMSVVTTGETAHGALLTALTSHDVTGVTPALDMPTVDLSSSSPQVRADSAAWPARLAVVTNSQAPYGRAQSLVVVPGQFTGSTFDGTGVQRLYSSMGMQVFYAPDASTDFNAPVIARSTGVALSNSATFTVSTTDAEGPVKRVVVGYHDFDGSWKFTNLSQGADPTSWTGNAGVSRTVTASDAIEYFVQVVDGAGNVATASGKAAGFDARITDNTPPTITAAVTPAANAAGWIKAASATVTFTCSDAGSGIESGACPTPVVVTTDGATTVNGSVSDRAGNPASTNVLVQLDNTAPSISATVTPAPNAAGWSDGPSAVVTFTCSDATSGIDPAVPCPAPVTVTAEGVSTVPGTVGDLAGNQASATATVRLDRIAPTITAAVAPTPNSAGWNHGSSATVNFTCSDGGSGLATGACPAAVVVTAEGATVVSGTVTDRAGNHSTASVTVRLDRTAPVVTMTGIPTAPACTTTDAGAGVFTKAVLLAVTVRVAGVPVTSATCLGASDRAGNVSAPIIRVFVAPIRFSGFQSPIAGPPVINVGTAGRSYTVKFQLRDAGNAFISALPAVTSTTFQSVNCSTFTGTNNALGSGTTASSSLAYVSSANQYVYTWKTPTPKGCYLFKLGLADGATYTANFNLK